MSSQLTYAYDSLTYWLHDRMKTINWLGKLFHGWVCQGTTENYKKYARFYRFLLITPVSIESFQF